MALQFTYYGKKHAFYNLFGNLQVLCDSINGANPSTGAALFMQFYGGTVPNISSLPTEWQGTAYTGSTKLWPQTNISPVVNSAFATNPQSNSLTYDWTNNIITTKASTVANQLLFGQGTLSWFALYAGTASQSTYTATTLLCIGTVGLSGSGADIELNRVDIPSADYPVDIVALSFKWPQPSGVDLIFNKHIYLTSLANTISTYTYRFFAGGNWAYNTYPCAETNAKTAASSGAVFQLYSGTRPSSPEDAVPAGNTLIGSVATSTSVSDLTFTASSSEVSAGKTGNFLGTSVSTGTPNWCRVLSAASGGYTICDCTAGVAGSGANVVLQDPITVAGQSINITSIKFLMG